MAEGVAFSFLGKLAERMVDPIVHQFSYLFFYNRNIENLEQELNGLQVARDGVQRQVDEAENNVETIDRVMRSWLERADEIERKSLIVMERRKSIVDRTCLNLGCFNVKQRYSLSRKATKLIIGIGKLKSNGDKYVKSTHSPSPPGIVIDDALFPELLTWIANSRSIPNFEGFESRKSIVEQVMEALKDEGIKMIGICGAGGVGKTTMANDVCKRAKAQGLFKEFAMTSVSQTQDLRKIQEELAGMLGLYLNDNDTIFLRAQRLRARLSSGRKILVILDDVWEELRLEEVGIPMGCKVICTSRNKDVLSDMGTQKFFDVGVLTNTESWDLFEANAGNSDDTTDRYATAKKIVKKCGGLPIAIVTLAKALKNKEKYVWDNALNHLEESSGEKIRGMPEHVYKCIELSCRFLKDSGARTLLLLCCLFPEDANIRVDILIRFKDLPTLEETKDGVRTLVGDLISCNLLVAYQEDKEFVKVHDVIRDVCLSIEGLNKLGGYREPSIWMANNSIVSRKSEFFVEARSQPVKEIILALGDDQICTIGICGMGVLGKRTLVNKVIEKVKEDNLFDDVAMTVVSHRLDLFEMQGDLARKLGLGSVREETSISERAKQLRARLTDGRRKLIILFDVWDVCKIDLEKVGIPVGSEHNKGCKVAILSRFEEVCVTMGSEKIFQVGSLSNEDALVLLREHAGRFDHEELDPIAKQIVDKCLGHPWIIVIIGEALKNQDKNVWLDALHQLQGCRELWLRVSTAIKFSYNGLSSYQAQMLLLLISIMGLGERDLTMEMVVVTYLKLYLKDDNKGDLQLEASPDKVIDILQHLYNRFLLDIHVHQNTVGVHQVIRDVCLLYLS